MHSTYDLSLRHEWSSAPRLAFANPGMDGLEREVKAEKQES
jgi:hypothetical protein